MDTDSFKVLLIATNQEKQPYPVYPLGAAMVSQALEADGVTVRGLDCTVVDDPVAAALEASRDFTPDLVAVSIRAVDNTCLLSPRFYIPEAAMVTAALRSTFGFPLLLGGSGFSLFPERILEELDADYGVVGEGETTAVELVRALRAGRSPGPVPGLIRRGDGHATIARSATPKLSPERWARPSYRAFPLEPHLLAGGVASVQTKRGCDHRCTYCTYPLLEGREFRLRNPEEVAREVVGISDLGVEHLFFVDSNFNLPSEHAGEICRHLIKTGRPLQWSAFVTPLGFNARLAELMFLSGARSLELGAEAGTLTTLKALGKDHTPEDIRAADAACFDVGLVPAHYFMFGGPGETEETVERTLALIDRLRGPVAAVLGIRLYPGTRLFERAIEEGVTTPQVDPFPPRFYVSPALNLEWLLGRLLGYAAAHRSFILVGETNELEPELAKRMRRRGRKGAMWEYMPI